LFQILIPQLHFGDFFNSIDPKLSSANVMKPDKFILVPDDIGGPGDAPAQCGSR
jgi:hypothetical protein